MKKQKKWIIIGIIALVALAFGKYNESKQAKEKAAEPPVIAKIEKPKTYREKFDEKNFSEIRGGYKPVREFLKKNINDPSSLEIVNTWNNGMNKDSTFAIKTTFRAKNAFNALIMQSMYCNIDMDGNLSEVNIE